MLQKTFSRHPLRIIGRTLWLSGTIFLVAVDYALNVYRRRESSHAARLSWMQRSARLLLRVFNLDWQTSGKIPARGLLVCNHLGYLDIVLLSAVAPGVFVSKREVKTWPVFGMLARMAGTVFVHREKRSEAGRSASEIKNALDRGALVILFPEGTSSVGETVLPFKSALLEPAAQSRHALSVGCIRYMLTDGSVADEVCYWGDMTLVPHLLNLLGKRSISAHVSFAAIQEPCANRKQLARRLHSEVLRLKDSYSVNNS
jgi:1-acyl-sn-glycerol-3-phosphate acyltransferase